MKISVAITTHNDRVVTIPKHHIIDEVIIYDKPHDSVFDAKLEAVKLCKNEWVLLLDSDDSFDDIFFDTIAKLNLKEERLYCPERPLPYSFKGYSDYLYTKDSIRYSIDEGNFIAFLICGGYLFNKQRYLNSCNVIHEKIWRNDCFYLKYLWLANLGSIHIVKGLQYNHNSQPDGVMATYATEIWGEVDQLKKMILQLEAVGLINQH